MSNTVRIIALIMMLVAVIVLITTQWLPILVLIPTGAAMALWNGEYFSTTSRSQQPRDRDDA
ncbi:hypothetical protein ACIGDM_04505 [Rothia koreensis]|jgi:hypothetical protein|uniref:hypothetical protein n=1 Tax=Rothia koreensis TaxID=592378 RepID=UPI0037C8E5B4